jgi:hypothetical protein
VPIFWVQAVGFVVHCVDAPSQHRLCKTRIVLVLVAIMLGLTSPVCAREKDTMPYGEGLIINVPFPENEVAQVVQQVVQNGIIRGSKEYNKDQYITGATAAPSAKGFPAWKEPGEVFYKVRIHALDPRNFKDSNDMGTLAVRYVVTAQGDKNSIVKINAIFVEDFRRTLHASNGSVEAAEYQDIHDRLDGIARMNEQAAEAARENEEARKTASVQAQSAKPANAATPVHLVQNHPKAVHDHDNNEGARNSASTPPPPLNPAPTATPAQSVQNLAEAATEQANSSSGVPETLEEQVRDLRRQVQRTVKAPGAALRSAPFHTATTLQSLPAGTEVLIVITTPYWFGVETHDGQHGWMLCDDLERLP